MMQLALASIVLALATFASTPLFAAQKFLAIKNGSVTHVAQAGSFAVASFSNSRIEGQRESGQLLLRRYSFGWQPIDGAFGSSFSRCSMMRDGVPSSVVPALSWRGSLSIDSISDCRDTRGPDFGSSSDIDGIRAVMARRYSDFLIGPVRVSHDFAVADYSIPGGGEAVLKRDAAVGASLRLPEVRSARGS